MLSKDFDYPSPICEDCALKLDEFLLFRAKCLRSNEIYRFNKLHKSRLVSGSTRLQSSGKDEDERKELPPPECTEDGHREEPAERDAFGTSSSSEGANVTVINNELPDASCVPDEIVETRKSTVCNGKAYESHESVETKPMDLPILDEAEVTAISEPVLTKDSSKIEEVIIDGISFPLGSIKELERLERRIQSQPETREKFISFLRTLKTHDTSLSETYQCLFTDALMIHYNYDGISPKYNKRPLKNLSIFTECMPVAWKDHMDANMVREAIIEAVKKSHNRYNQCSHRKRARQVYL
ncbi:uncharacterized protein LOC128741778 isoform X2 [Sabethes cyaneus]|nr:uncharacterized protein LOC128741778 isoform X2 [Sabethes cyaneus]XP_053693786.1 uncharacterized protein LOC128741778 isoform X2 [Sabethes cyaneus]XP_053693787.1 uncharacterized protein LOC128741778 isoform X2 [Sabethes cyaneus]